MHTLSPTWALFCFCLVLSSRGGDAARRVAKPLGLDTSLTARRAAVTGRPQWPAQFEVSWDFTVPYVNKLQKGGLKYKYQAWQDTETGRQRVERNGLETSLEITETKLQYDIYPRMDVYGCRVGEIDGGKGPTRRLLDRPPLHFLLPDLTHEKWAYNGTADIAGAAAQLWSWTWHEDYGYGNWNAVYRFYVTPEGAPLKLHMQGVNLYTGGHYDEYIATYYDYKPGPIKESMWAVPAVCANKTEAMTAAHRHNTLAMQVARALPNRHFGDGEYDSFAHRHGRKHRTAAEYHDRKQVYHGNKAFIEEHNQGSASHKLGMNHFGDMTHAEWVELMLPNHGAQRPAPDTRYMRQHRPATDPRWLPRTVDWRGTLADSPVKDQAACGSCWAFGSVGSLETAYYRETGKQLLLSEQHFLDCAWEYGNTGCMGGYQELAYPWVFDNGGIASEADYPYAGVTQFCRKDAPLALRFKGKPEFVWVKGGELALMEALYSKGPMTVSVDAEDEGMRFYKSGLYQYKKCQTKLKRLDHAVLVSGYGTTQDGQDYWIVKNTWSALWGEAGYIRIIREPNDCGIATQPIYIEMEVDESQTLGVA